MKTICITLILIGLCAPLTAGATNWVPVAGNNKTNTFVDKDSIRKNGQYVKVWLLWLFATPENVPGSHPEKSFQSQKTLYIYDCKNGTYGFKQITYYAEPSANGGDVVDTHEFDERLFKFSEPPPDSIGEILLKYVCTASKNNKNK